MKKRELSNPNASTEAKRLFEYLCDMHGKKILAGQQESPAKGKANEELEYIFEVTGKLPAIRGLDYIDDDFEGVNARVVEWDSRNGIVTICWHWGIPPVGKGYPSSQESIDIEDALTEGTKLNLGMLKQMDEVAEALKELRDLHIPVLWRPYHEFDGAWFWWGKGGSEQFKRLWKLMYERFTMVHELNNLIWVLSYSWQLHEDWYPGDDFYDIIGTDIYEVGEHKSSYDKLALWSGTDIPIAYSECGPIPDPDNLVKEQVNWAWFMTWHTIHIKEQNTPDYLKRVYRHERVLTLEDMPQWRKN